ncbi:hypothetical protein AC579_9007 [Pseudocercospora musae]|uniref:Uncharacterized protein n=1 Tax=Pseudocercospora musae TaxID=113226 RepID=A0A139I4L1_9PEZI|nr:hypothetical protein AC579_9007 [Pseudocercospora musae]
MAMAMAEDEGKKSKAPSFLKKSKWGKVLKERSPDAGGGDDDSGAAGRQQGAFTLNEDVVDFLKPSTDKSKPKIDIAIAQRWPDAHEVRRAGEPHGAAFTKPKRRKGLTVSFVKTLPDIIGEGGDEAQDPPSEISRMKAAVSRSVSDRKPGTVGDWPRSPPLADTHATLPPPAPPQDFVPPPIRRMHTSGNEFSPAMQRKIPSPPTDDWDPYRPTLARVSTGFDALDASHTTPLDTPIMPPHTSNEITTDAQPSQPDLHPPGQRPARIDTHLQDQRPQPASATAAVALSAVKDYLQPSPDSATRSPVVEKRRQMSTSEGMVLRRASMMIAKDADSEDSDEQPASSTSQGPRLVPQPSNTFSIGTSVPQVFSPPDSGLSPETAATPDAPSPFADPKHMKRHSREVSSGASRTSNDQAKSLRGHKPPREYSRSPQPTGAPSRTEHKMVPQIAPPQSQGHQRAPSKDEDYMRAIRAPAGQSFVPSRPDPRPSSRDLSLPTDTLHDVSRSPQPRHRHLNPAPPAQDNFQFFTKPNGSSSSINNYQQRSTHSRSTSRDDTSPDFRQPPGQSYQQPLSPGYQGAQISAGSHDRSPRSSLLGPGRMSGSAPSPVPSISSRTRPEDYFAAPSATQGQSVRSPMATLRQEESARPGSAGSNHSRPRSSYSLQLASESSPAADAAFADFAARVQHMKGVFKLTAEKELPGDRCTPTMWLRAGLWWYLVGKSGLETLLQQQRNSSDRRDLLTQAHVDLAKAWWILTGPLETYESHDGSPLSVDSGESPDARTMMGGVSALKAHLRTLALSMSKNRILPPEQSLIQGQNTRIWVEYSRFTSDAMAVLGGNASKSILLHDSKQVPDPYDMLPLGDGREYFCYGRFPVDVFLNTEDSETDRVLLPCMLTVIRGRQDFQTSISIASQSELVNVRILARPGERRSLTWSDLTWKASACGILVHLPRNFDLSVRMQERDFRAVWNLSEYARKVEKCLRPEAGEIMIHEARLAELQYADSSNPNAFAPDKVRGCTALVFERQTQHVDGNGMRKVHRGYRLLLVTDPGHKTLSAVSHEIGTRTPFYFEYLTDPTAQGTTAMVIRFREETRQCRALLVFPDADTRQLLYDVLNGLSVGPDETIVGRMSLTSLSIEPASQSAAFSQSAHPALQQLQWQKLGVTNSRSEDPNSRVASTVQSDKLRIVARHSLGCITDRLNLGKGELLLRVPTPESASVQILREPQQDMTMSIDTRNSPQHVAEGVGQLLHAVMKQPSIRTFTFASREDLHAFQTAITGHTVRYDGLASGFGISRRRMVVPIYKKLEASNVRVQIVSRDSVVQLLAFMEEFNYADAMCFQIKSTDVFEQSKGDSKGKKWSVKMVDAKFSLPPREKEDSEEMRLKQRFVNLEGLDYAEEHDDITIGFDSEQDRDRFAQALPAATSVHRGITLKRRT